MRKILSVTAVAFMLASGAAFAQTNPPNAGADAAATDPNAMDKQLYGSFYTDDTMGSLRTDEEFAAAWTAMAAENQAKVREQCKNPTSEKLKEFCGKVPAQ